MKRLIQLGAFVLALAIAIPALAMGLEEAKQKLDTVKQQGLVGGNTNRLPGCSARRGRCPGRGESH